MPSAHELISRIITWKRERPTLDLQNKQVMESGEMYSKDGLFLGEVDEFRVAVADTLQEKAQDVDVASELADILFLCVSNLDSQGKDPALLLADELKVDANLTNAEGAQLQTIWFQSILYLLREVEYLSGIPEDEVVSAMIRIAKYSNSALYAYGFDPLSAVEGKLLRNEAKYPAELFQQGTYEDAAKEAKKSWGSRKTTENERYVGPARLRSGQLSEE